MILSLYIYVRSIGADGKETEELLTQAEFNITIVGKTKPHWYLSGGEDPKDRIKWEGTNISVRVNGKPVPDYNDWSYYPFDARPGDSLEITMNDFPRGDHYSLGPLWLHLWDGAKKVKLADSVDLGTLKDDLTINYTVEVYKKNFTIPPLKTPLTVDPAELVYDDGVSDGGVSLGGKNQYGFLVRFTPETPFKVTKIKIFSWIKDTPKEDTKFTVSITDKNLLLRWNVSLPYTLFTIDHSWIEVEVPDFYVDKEFCIEVYAPSFGPGTGPYVGVDQTGANLHSEMISNWKSTAWDTPIPQDQANWMIRVEGNPVSPFIEWFAGKTPAVTSTTNTELTLGGWTDSNGIDLQNNDLVLGTPFSFVATLTSSGKPLDGKTVNFEVLADGKWISLFAPYTMLLEKDYLNPPIGSGRAELIDAGRDDDNSIITKPGAYQFRATFAGDSTYIRSVAYFNVKVIPWATLEAETNGQKCDVEFKNETWSGVCLDWDAYITVSGKLYDGLKQPISKAPISFRYLSEDGQVWQELPGGKSTTDEWGEYQVKIGGGPTPVFSQQGNYQIKAVFVGGDYNEVTFTYTESAPIYIYVGEGSLSIKIKSFNDNPVSFEDFAVTCTLTPNYGIPVTGPVEVVLYANRNGFGALEVARFSGPYLDTITFRINLTSGNYEIYADLKESNNYWSNRSDSVNIKVGN